MGILRRLGNALRGGRLDRDIKAELEAHVALRTEANHAAGLAADDASRDAMQRLGNDLLLRERVRDVELLGWLDELRRDIALGIRLLRRSPGFTSVAVVTLGLAIGANAAVFSFLDAVMLRRPPFANSDRIVEVVSTDPHGVIQVGNPIWASDYADFRDHASAFEKLAGYDSASANLAAPGVSAHVSLMHVTVNYFSVFGVAPAQGRAFLPGEDQPGHEHEVVLSDSVWRAQFAAAPVLGKVITLDGLPYTVVGVMPRWFAQHWYPTDLWIPMTLNSAELSHNRATARPIFVVGRLRPGAGVAEAASEVGTLARHQATTGHGWSETVVTLQRYEQMQINAGSGLTLLFLIVGLILLIACASVAGLLLTRGAARAPEMAIRQALGARRGRLVRQLLTESGLIAAAAGAFGVFVAWLGMPWMNSTLGRQSDLHFQLNGNLMAFTTMAAVATALLFGVAPAWQVCQAHLLPGGGATAHSRRQRLRSGLVVVEIAFSLIALVASAVAILEIRHELEQPTGYQPRGVLTANLNVAGPAYATAQQRALFIQRLAVAAAALPGAEGAALVSPPALAWDQPNVQVQDREVQAVDNQPMLKVLAITSGYFAVLKTPLLAGRVFTEADAQGTRPVVIISRSVARHLFPHAASPIGQYLRIERNGEPGAREVVGEVGDMSFYLDEDTASRLAIFEPLAEASQQSVGLLVRTTVPPAMAAMQLRTALARLDPTLPLFKIQPLWDRLTADVVSDNAFGDMLALFGALILALAALGLYGVVAYAAAQRRREVGIRMALGSSRAQATRLLLWTGLRLALIGLFVGIILAELDSFLLAHLFQGIETRSWEIFGTPTLLLLAVVLAASGLPAWRAARCEPMNVLKEN